MCLSQLSIKKERLKCNALIHYMSLCSGAYNQGGGGGAISRRVSLLANRRASIWDGLSPGGFKVGCYGYV